MQTLPSQITPGSGEHTTRISCPDCTGVLTVSAEGERGFLALTCRIGHRFSVPELLAAKEDRLEDRLWEALYSLQELADILKDLAAYAERYGLSRAVSSFDERARRAEAQVAALRQILDENRAVELDDQVGKIRGGRS